MLKCYLKKLGDLDLSRVAKGNSLPAVVYEDLKQQNSNSKGACKKLIKMRRGVSLSVEES